MGVRMRAELVAVGSMDSQKASLEASTKPFSNEHMAQRLREDRREAHQAPGGEVVLQQRTALSLRASHLHLHLDLDLVPMRRGSSRYDTPFLVY
jgi:hypothetical protein